MKSNEELAEVEKQWRKYCVDYLATRQGHWIHMVTVNIQDIMSLLEIIDDRIFNHDMEREKVWRLTNAIKDHKQAKLDFFEGDTIRADAFSTDADRKLWGVVS